MNVEDLTLENIGIWPTWAKVVVVGLVCSFIVGLFFFFDIKPMRSQLLQAELADKELRATYEIKSEQAANLDEYKAQVEEINQRIEGMLAQLPKTLDVPNLIEDISKMGISAGLEFKSIRPQPEIEQDYYTELPLAITVTGTYHQLAEFVSNLASLQRIVTLDDFTITRPKVDRSIQRLREVAQSKNIQLSMDITAKTYKQSRSFKKNQSAGQQGQVTNASN
ncbi:MAG: pilus assembly protein PilP [Legionellales bacterium]|nr:pilus assembly protein PilP [Legionellales bacterium]|tara:strand:+ start:870 stop:1535 length:666 start_codon:yes stop_codon:yes gene_type:complete